MSWLSSSLGGITDIFGGSGANLGSLTPGGVLDTLMGKDSMREQNAYNERMWSLQNEYNKPINQMRRYEEAGLNPLLIYNQGNPGNATGHPVSASPKESGASALSKVFSTVSAIKSMQAMSAQVDNMKAQNKLINTQAEGMAIKNALDAYNFDWLKNRGLSPYAGALEKNTLGMVGSNAVGSLANSIGGILGSLMYNMFMRSREIRYSNRIGELKDLGRY